MKKYIDDFIFFMKNYITLLKEKDYNIIGFTAIVTVLYILLDISLFIDGAALYKIILFNVICISLLFVILYIMIKIWFWWCDINMR